MNPLESIFGAVVSARNALYDNGTLKAQRLDGPVVSIGNLSVGGAGKTPFVILLGGLLAERGLRFDVLSRGYGRRRGGVRVVDPGGLPQDFGDEPLLIARRLSAPVVIGEDRFAAGRLAEKQFGTQLHLLDDGSAAEDFPAGGKLLWRVRRGLGSGKIPDRPVAFCGIARPKNFFLQLRTAGVEPAAHAVYRDHHAYGEKDVRELLTLRQSSGAGGFVTTEKDAVNLGGYLSALEPLAVVPVKMELVDAAAAVDAMLGKIAERRAVRA